MQESRNCFTEILLKINQTYILSPFLNCLPLQQESKPGHKGEILHALTTMTPTSHGKKVKHFKKRELTGLSLATPSRMAKISVNPIAIHKLTKILARGDFTCFQKQACMRIVNTMPTNDIEHPTVEIVSNILRSDSVS
jgi:DNA topoisomerase VI subunit B